LSSTEGFQDITICRQAAVVDKIGVKADHLIAAHMGDLWLDDMGLVNKILPSKNHDRLARYVFNKIVKPGRLWLLANLCPSNLRSDGPDKVLWEIILQEIEKTNYIEDQDFRVKAFKVDQWVFRWTNASLRMFQPAAFPRLPFYDTRLSDFFCTVPSEFVSQRRLQIDYLKRFAPDLARIKWEVYDTNLWRYQHFHTWLLPKRALKKAWRILTHQQVVQRNWEVQFLSPVGRQGLERWLLRPGLRLHEFVAPAALQALVQTFYDQPLDPQRGYTVSMLLTFSAWLERYG
jgi:hypothetical protein